MIIGLASRNQFKAASKGKSAFSKRPEDIKAIGQAIDEAHNVTGKFEQCKALVSLRLLCEQWFQSNAELTSFTPHKHWFGGTGSHRYDGVTAIAAQIDALLADDYSTQYRAYRKIKGLADPRVARKGLTTAYLHNKDYQAEFLDPGHNAQAKKMYTYYETSKNSVGMGFAEWLDGPEGSEFAELEARLRPFTQVRYLKSDERIPYRLKLIGGKYYRDIDGGEAFDTTDHESSPTNPGWAIFVLSPSGFMYAHSKDPGRFHHSTFLAGKAVAAAGCLKARDGIILAQNNASGHYIPGSDHQLQFVTNIRRQMSRSLGERRTDRYLRRTLKVSTSAGTGAASGPYYTAAEFLSSGGNPTKVVPGP